MNPNPKREIIQEIDDGIIYLRKIVKQDAYFLLNSLKDKQLTKYMVLRPLKSLKDIKNLIKKHLDYWEHHLQFNYIIEIEKEHIKESIGLVNLWNINWTHKRAEIGIWIIPSYWRKRYGRKALDLIKIVGFNHLKFNRLEAHVIIKNKRSVNFFMNCGFKKECVLQKYLNLRGLYYDTILLRILKSEL